MGDHVKVIGGRYEGDTGLIVRVEDTAVLFSDLTMHELKVFPKDLQLCSERSSGVDSMGQHQFGDLVQLDPQTVGVIIRLDRDTFQVLNQHGKVVQVKHQAVGRRRENKGAVALDSEQVNIPWLKVCFYSFMHMLIQLSICSSIHLSICLFIHLFILPSIHL